MKNVKKMLGAFFLGLILVGNAGAMQGQKRNIGAQQGQPVPPVAPVVPVVVPPVVPQQQNVVPVLVLPVVPNIQAQLRFNRERLRIEAEERNIREALNRNWQDLQGLFRQARDLSGDKNN